jgi:hypothetical protein
VLPSDVSMSCSEDRYLIVKDTFVVQVLTQARCKTVDISRSNGVDHLSAADRIDNQSAFRFTLSISRFSLKSLDRSLIYLLSASDRFLAHRPHTLLAFALTKLWKITPLSKARGPICSRRQYLNTSHAELLLYNAEYHVHYLLTIYHVRVHCKHRCISTVCKAGATTVLAD